MKSNFFYYQINVCPAYQLLSCFCICCLSQLDNTWSRGAMQYDTLFRIRAQIYSTVSIKTLSMQVFVDLCNFVIRASEEICEIWTFHFTCQKVSKFHNLKYAYNVNNYTHFWNIKQSLKSSLLLDHQIKANIWNCSKIYMCLRKR